MGGGLKHGDAPFRVRTSFLKNKLLNVLENIQMIREKPNDSTVWQPVRDATALDMKELLKLGAFDQPHNKQEFPQNKPFRFDVKLYTGEVILTVECRVTLFPHGGQLRLVYDLIQGGEKHQFDYIVSLEKMPCRYGGWRWWAKCFHCGKRVRILYLSQRRSCFACRDCQTLRYDSQLHNMSQGLINGLKKIDGIEELERKLDRTRSPRKRALIESRLVRRSQKVAKMLQCNGRRKHLEWTK